MSGSFVEGLCVSALGAAAGLLLAAWGVRTLHAITWFTLPRTADVAIDGRVLTFALALTTLTGIVCGIAPALQLSRGNLMGGLRHAGGASRIAGGRYLHAALVVVEVALSLVLLAGAGLMIRTLGQLATVDPGFQPQGLITTNLQQSNDKYGHDEARSRFADRLVEDLRATAGVSGAAVAWPLDMVGFSWSPYANFRDRPFPEGQAPPVQMAAVSPGFFDVMGIRLVQGRTFDARDRSGAPVVAVVNETLARRFLPPGDPTGRHMSLVGIPELQDVEIVGVVNDTLRGGPSGKVAPEVYCPYAQFPSAGPTVIVRGTTGDPLLLARTIEDRIAAIDPGVAPFGTRRLSDVVSATIGDRRMLTLLLAIFGVVAVSVTGLGIAAVVAYMVAQRTQEIGVRVVLGADAGSVLRLVIRGALGPVLCGLTAGLILTIPFTRLIRTQLFGVESSDPIALAAGAIVILGAALLAAYLPARRATRIDPMMAMRIQ